MPDFNGVDYVALETKVRGTSHQFPREVDHGDSLVIVAEVTLTEQTLKDKKDGPVLVQVFKAENVYELDPDDRTVLGKYRDRARLADDHAKGRTALPFGTVDDTEHPGVELVLDGSGVVMSEAEVEALAGGWLPERYISVRFADGTEGLWPDDWEGSGQSLAVAGGFMRRPGKHGEPGEVVQVRLLQDQDSGDVLGEWTGEQESARLEALEAAAAAEEAEADRQATDEVLAARVAEVDGLPVERVKVGAVVPWARTASEVDCRRAFRQERSAKNRASVIDAVLDRLAELGHDRDTVQAELDAELDPFDGIAD